MSFDAEPILVARDLCKRFQLGQFVSLASTLRTLKSSILQPHKLWNRKANTQTSQQRIEEIDGKQYLWALQNINFELYRGERIAILGRNGAGKSTLLKILVGIMSPTSGTYQATCRMVPLMGVGAGFNPELTGRENVFVYGAILGVPPKEIKAHYEEIVEFAEIPNFMETPLKRYSKGMRARLGMAVALKLNPDVLVVDEVLAVGDVKFRAKCMEEMQRLCEQGMTLLFVSHSPARVKALCTRAILLREGKLVADGDIHKVLNKYIEEDMGDVMPQDMDADEEISAKAEHHYLPRVDWELEHAPGDDIVKITMVRVANEQGEECQDFGANQSAILEMQYSVYDEEILRPQFQVFNQDMEVVFATIDTTHEIREHPRMPGVYVSKAIIPANLLVESTYLVGASVYSHKPLVKHARTAEVVSFKIHSVEDPSSSQSDYPRVLVGMFRPLLTWETEKLSDIIDQQHMLKMASNE